jgi:L-cystine uptake protein TcyP (sodium:dicarboxylate symporter family)
MIVVLILSVVISGLAGLMVAGVLVVIQWVLEGIFRHHVGVYFGYAELLTALGLIAFILYKSDEICGRGSPSCIDGGEFFAGIPFVLVGLLGLIVMPLVLVSTLRLSKWSANRATFGGY